jgi:hypothetical protein
VADERDKIRAMMGLPSTATKDPVVVGGTPFGQAGTAQAPQTPMSYGGTSFGQAGSAAPTASNEYESVINEVNKTIKDAKKTLTLAKKSGNKKDIAAAQSLVDLSKGELSDLVKLAGSLGATGGAGIVNPGYSQMQMLLKLNQLEPLIRVRITLMVN